VYTFAAIWRILTIKEGKSEIEDTTILQHRVPFFFDFVEFNSATSSGI
jgi:hypothetical protein